MAERSASELEYLITDAKSKISTFQKQIKSRLDTYHNGGGGRMKDINRENDAANKELLEYSNLLKTFEKEYAVAKDRPQSDLVFAQDVWKEKTKETNWQSLLDAIPEWQDPAKREYGVRIKDVERANDANAKKRADLLKKMNSQKLNTHKEELNRQVVVGKKQDAASPETLLERSATEAESLTRSAQAQYLLDERDDEEKRNKGRVRR